MRRALPLTLLLGVAAGSAHAADRAVQLRVPYPVAKGVAALPPIAEPVDDAERRINAALPRLDATVRKAVAQCRKDGGKNSSWERSIDVPMRGPGFLTYVITDNVYCGGVHPNTSTLAVVYDLQTGTPVDWTALLPSTLTGQLSLFTGLDDTRTVALSGQALYDGYVRHYRKRPDKTRDGNDAECRDVIKQAGTDAPPAMSAWLDARQGGLVVHFELPHYAQACEEAVVIPVADLHAAGAKQVLIDALAVAHDALKSR